MRKIIVLSFISLDGVMQAPGGPEEDTSHGFKFGGWTVPYFDEFSSNVMLQQLGHPFDLLLGRKTYDIFSSYWPLHNDPNNPIATALNDATKFVASNSPLKLNWEKKVQLKGDIIEELRKLKQGNGPELQVHGSGNLIQTLLKFDLVDELWLKIFPLTLGPGKRLFESGAIPAAFKLSESSVSPKGVIVANYSRSGKVETGSF
jgi:dihydrofolate reductase